MKDEEGGSYKGFSELESYNFKKGIENLFSDVEIREKILTKVITSRYINPKVHKLDYLKGILTRKEITELKKLILTRKDLTLEDLPINFLLRFEQAFLKYNDPKISFEKLGRFLFPLYQIEKTNQQ